MTNKTMLANTSQPYRIAFIHAPDPVYADTQNYGAKFMPVWAYTLGAHIPGDGRFKLSLTDCRFESEAGITEADVYLFSGNNPVSYTHLTLPTILLV